MVFGLKRSLVSRAQEDRVRALLLAGPSAGEMWAIR